MSPDESRRPSTQPRPSVLFVCVKNGGKSQLAAALARRHGEGRIDVYSAGTRPGPALNEESRAAAEEVGASMQGEHPKPIDPTLLDTVDRVVVLGAEASIERPGAAPIEVWETDEPSARGITGAERMRLVRDDIDARVKALLASLNADSRG